MRRFIAGWETENNIKMKLKAEKMWDRINKKETDEISESWLRIRDKIRHVPECLGAVIG